MWHVTRVRSRRQMSRRLPVAVSLCLVILMTGCGEREDSSTSFPCMGQFVTTVEQCAQLLTADLERATQQTSQWRYELDLQAYETGRMTIGDLIQQHSATVDGSGQTISEMIAASRDTQQQAQALAQVPEMTQTSPGQQALADYYARQTEILQRRTELIERQRAEDDAAFRDWEARQEQERIEEAARLQSDLQDKIHEAELYRDELAEQARASAEAAELWGP